MFENENVLQVCDSVCEFLFYMKFHLYGIKSYYFIRIGNRLEYVQKKFSTHQF